MPVDRGEPEARGIDVASAWDDVGRRLRAWASRRVDPADADDIVQSVMLRLLERRHEVEEASVAAWLFTVTRNAVAEHYRRKRPSVALDGFQELPADRGSDPADRTRGELSDCLEPMLAALGPADAEVLRRVDLEGEPQVALAERLGIPLSTVKSRVQRARARLRATFDACCSIQLARDGAPIGLEPGPACGPNPCAPTEER